MTGYPYGYRLNPDCDWDSEKVRQAWREYGRLIGRFLKEDEVLTLSELTEYARAYAAQRPDGVSETVTFTQVSFEAHELCLAGIALLVSLPRLKAYNKQTGLDETASNADDGADNAVGENG